MNYLPFLNNKASGDDKVQQSYSRHNPYDEEHKEWESDFGLKYREKPNVNIKIRLRDKECDKFLFVDVNGKSVWKDRIKDESLSKERLAGKPLKYMTEFGRHLSIGFNLETAQFTLKHNGNDVEKLPEVEKELRICRNKTKHS